MSGTACLPSLSKGDHLPFDSSLKFRGLRGHRQAYHQSDTEFSKSSCHATTTKQHVFEASKGKDRRGGRKCGEEAPRPLPKLVTTGMDATS